MGIKCGEGIDSPGELRIILSQRMAAEMQSENQEKKEKKTHDGGVRGFLSGCSGEEPTHLPMQET